MVDPIELYKACEEGNLKAVNALLAQGVSKTVLNFKFGEQKHTPLWIACHNGHLDVVKRLLEESKIDVNKKDDAGRTAFYVACEKGYLKIVEALLSHQSIKPNICIPNGMTPLAIAYSSVNGRRHMAVTKRLLSDKKYNPNQITEKCWPPFIIACDMGDENIVESLLARKKLKIMQTDSWGRNGLHTACKKAHEKVVKKLLKDGRININEQTNDGATALFFAIDTKSPTIVRSLLEAGADTTIKYQGQSPWDKVFELYSDRRHENDKAVYKAIILEMIMHTLFQQENIDPEFGSKITANAETKNGIQQIYSENLEFISNQIKQRREEQAAEIFALIVFQCDGFLDIKMKCLQKLSNFFARDESSAARAVRFFRIASQLPLDLQQALSQRVIGQGKDVLGLQKTEAAFHEVAKQIGTKNKKG
jgi:ankyrin repeat protein